MNGMQYLLKLNRKLYNFQHFEENEEEKPNEISDNELSFFKGTDRKMHFP